MYAEIITDAKEDITADPQEPVDPANIIQFRIKQAKVRDLIMKSIPRAIYNKINTAIFSETPYRM